MSDRADGLTLRIKSRPGNWRRIRIEPRSDGRYDYHTDRWSGCKWLPEGHEIVADVEAEGALPGAAVLEEVR